MKHCGLKFRRSLGSVYPDRLLHPSETRRAPDTLRDRDKELWSERGTERSMKERTRRTLSLFSASRGRLLLTRALKE